MDEQIHAAMRRTTGSIKVIFQIKYKEEHKDKRRFVANL